MKTLISQKHKGLRYILSISILFMLLVGTVTFPVMAEEKESVETLRQIGKSFSSIAEKTSPAVVGIKTEKVVSTEGQTYHDWPFEDDFFDQFFRRQRPRSSKPKPKSRQLVQGSGFIITTDGYILTNNHVVANADKVIVKLADDREFEAKVIGADPDSEVAVVKIDAKGLSYLKLADSDKLEVGEWVLAIGNPFGLSHTVTAGIVSAKGRSGIGLAAYEDFIQTDAAINPGNSGGPLINLDGEAVGINTAIISRSGGYMGIGLAIPINMAKYIYEQLVEGGTVVRGVLGVYIKELDADLAESLGLEENTKGVAIAEVLEGSAAENAGIKRYDVVVEFNDEKVEKANEFRNRIAMLKPGTKVEVVVLREGKKKKLTVELGEKSKTFAARSSGSEIIEGLGFSVENLTDALADRYGYEMGSGVIVSEVDSDSSAGQAGITPGVLIMEVNQKAVKNTRQFAKEIEKAKDGKSVLLLLDNGRYRILLALPLKKK